MFGIGFELCIHHWVSDTISGITAVAEVVNLHQSARHTSAWQRAESIFRIIVVYVLILRRYKYSFHVRNVHKTALSMPGYFEFYWT